MLKKILLSFFLFVLFTSSPVYASDNSFVTIVNPIRGSDFWDNSNPKIETGVLGQSEILTKNNVPATWLIRYDALTEKTISDLLKSKKIDEVGLLLEITPTLTEAAGVKYNKTQTWHSAGSVFVTGYELSDRKKLIDASFEKFKSTFGYYPKSVGAWWIDSGSLSYMQEKYGITAALIVADQYSTDNYQIWGQYFGTPYYPSIKNALNPAQSKENKIPVVVMQWAPRDPYNGYGRGVEESTYSVQSNDYIDFHDLGIKYFTQLVDIYTNQPNNQFNQMVIGLENTYSWQKYKSEYQNQINVLSDKQEKGQFKFATMQNFSDWYQKKFPDISPEQIIITNDPLLSEYKSVWYMNPHYRVGWFYNPQGSVIRDIRQYLEGQEEICLNKKCNEINFATYVTRVLDEVTYGQNWIIDEGKIKDFKVNKKNNNYYINYINQSENARSIGFLPRDIDVNGRIHSIDGAILDATINSLQVTKKSIGDFTSRSLSQPLVFLLLNTIYFAIIFILFFFVPGSYFVNKLINSEVALTTRNFLSIIIGISVFIFMGFISLLLTKTIYLVIAYLVLMLILFIYSRSYNTIKFGKPSLKSSAIILMILCGSLFQLIPVFRSGLIHDYGMGFWGPNGHDAIWHIALVEKISQGIPIESPILSNTILTQYHFFYDLLLSVLHSLTLLQVTDLMFRFLPLLFSLILGFGVYVIMKDNLKVSNDRLKYISILFALFLTFFAGSFGWIVDYIRQGMFTGESAFWANQSISFNLNPPFALSLVIVFGILVMLTVRVKNIYGLFLYALIVGLLIEIKAYAAILVFGGLGFVTLWNLFKRDYYYLKLSLLSVFFSFLFLVPSLMFSSNSNSLFSIFIFSPFWFIHTMLEANDRVPWQRIVLMRTAGFESGNYLKVIVAEVVGLLLFIIGNLGIRFIGIFAFFQYKWLSNKDLAIFLITALVLSFVIPLLFIQTGTPWNTIQFMYYGLYLMCIPAGLVFGWLMVRLPKVGAVSIGLLLVVLVPINSITTAEGYFYPYPHTYISKDELSALDFLSKRSDGIVLNYPYDKSAQKRINEPFPIYIYESTAYVSGFTGKSSFVADILQQEILNTGDINPEDLANYKKRLIDSKTFFNTKDPTWSKNFIKKYNIRYIYLIKDIQSLPLEGEIDLHKIYDNNEVVIYENTL